MSDGGPVATVTASDCTAASSALMDAVDGAAASGYGECYWRHTSGEYRWMLRRDGEKVRIAVLWSNGTLTGWEHVFWSECGFEPFASLVREQMLSPKIK